MPRPTKVKGLRLSDLEQAMLKFSAAVRCQDESDYLRQLLKDDFSSAVIAYMDDPALTAEHVNAILPTAIQQAEFKSFTPQATAWGRWLEKFQALLQEFNEGPKGGHRSRMGMQILRGWRLASNKPIPGGWAVEAEEGPKADGLEFWPGVDTSPDETSE